MRAKPTLAVDIDEVLARHNQALARFHNEKYGTNHTEADYFTEHWSQVWGTEHEEAERRAVEFHETGAHSTLEPVVGAPEALKTLGREYRLILVTVRRKSIVAMTHEWIAQHFPDTFDDIRFVHAWDEPDTPSKAEVCQEIGAEVLIDDSVKHCRLMAGAGKRALLFGSYAWNQTDELPEGVTRVADWPEVLDYFYLSVA